MSGPGIDSDHEYYNQRDYIIMGIRYLLADEVTEENSAENPDDRSDDIQYHKRQKRCFGHPAEYRSQVVDYSQKPAGYQRYHAIFFHKILGFFALFGGKVFFVVFFKEKFAAVFITGEIPNYVAEYGSQDSNKQDSRYI